MKTKDDVVLTMESVFKSIEVGTLAHSPIYVKKPQNALRKPIKIGNTVRDGVPFVIHPIRVLRKVHYYLEEWPSSKPYQDKKLPMLVVASLHDVYEDTNYPIERLEAEFGAEVIEGIKLLTNPSKEHPELDRDVRKLMDRRHYEKIAPHWQVIKMWDRIDNVLDMLDYSHKFILGKYVPESRELEKVLRSADEHVADQLVNAIDWLEAITKGSQAAKKITQ